MPERAPSAATAMVGASAEPRFVLGPLTLYADVAVMEAWLETSAPGDELKYATGPALGRDAPAGKLARAWADEGEVALFQRRPGPGKPLEYVARRKEPEVAAGHGHAHRRMARPALGAPADFAETQAGRVFGLLVQLAAQGLACPNNRRIAELLDLSSAEQARYAMTRLVRAGMIRVEAASTFDPRIVTIVNTGARTAAPPGRKGK